MRNNLKLQELMLKIVSISNGHRVNLIKWHFNRLGNAKNFIFNKPRHNSPCLHPSLLGYK